MPSEIEGMTTACEGQSGRGVPGIVGPLRPDPDQRRVSDPRD